MSASECIREGLALASLFLVLGLWSVLGYAMMG